MLPRRSACDRAGVVRGLCCMVEYLYWLYVLNVLSCAVDVFPNETVSCPPVKYPMIMDVSSKAMYMEAATGSE